MLVTLHVYVPYGFIWFELLVVGLAELLIYSIAEDVFWIWQPLREDEAARADWNEPPVVTLPPAHVTVTACGVTVTLFVVPGVVWSIPTLPIRFVPAGVAAPVFVAMVLSEALEVV